MLLSYGRDISTIHCGCFLVLQLGSCDRTRIGERFWLDSGARILGHTIAVTLVIIYSLSTLVSLSIKWR